MVCVCGKDWDWDANPLAIALEENDKESIERFLLELGDVNARTVRETSPMNYYLSGLGAHPDTYDIVKMFARLGARASHDIYVERLCSAVRDADMDLFKLLLELFVGAGEQCLLDALGVALKEVCDPVRDAVLSKSEAARLKSRKCEQTQMALTLIDEGAPVRDAANILFQMSSRRRGNCPAELAQVLTFAWRPIGVGQESDEVKADRAARLMKSRQQSINRKHRQAKVAKTDPSKKERAKGGRHKAGEALVSSDSVL